MCFQPYLSALLKSGTKLHIQYSVENSVFYLKNNFYNKLEVENIEGTMVIFCEP